MDNSIFEVLIIHFFEKREVEISHIFVYSYIRMYEYTILRAKIRILFFHKTVMFREPDIFCPAKSRTGLKLSANGVIFHGEFDFRGFDNSNF